jgi:hypothetical protein
MEKGKTMNGKARRCLETHSEASRCGEEKVEWKGAEMRGEAQRRTAERCGGKTMK